MQIELREYQKQDFKTVETIIRETWHYDESFYCLKVLFLIFS